MKTLLLGVMLLAAVPRDEENLIKAATFYASFDEAVKADFGGGDLELSTRNPDPNEKGRFVYRKGYPSNCYRISEGRGNAGGALESVDVPADNGRIFFPAKGNIAHKKGGWSASLSVWVSFDPDTQLKTKFCDPIQITSKSAGNGGLWFDFNDAKPRNMRMGVFPAVTEARPMIKESREAWSPMVWVDSPGFHVGEWHHIVMNWHNLDTGRNDGRAALFIDGKLMGEIKDKDFPLTMDWDLDKAGIYVAISYIGLMDELALFDRPLTEADIAIIRAKPGVLAPLKKK